MKSKPGNLFDDSEAPTVSETVELKVNDDYAKRLLVSIQTSLQAIVYRVFQAR